MKFAVAALALVMLSTLIQCGLSRTTQSVFDCITIKACQTEYLACAASSTCQQVLNSQASCRYNSNCNLVRDIDWDPLCYYKCRQSTSDRLYSSLQSCAEKSCQADSRLIRFTALVFAVLALVMLF